MPTVRRLRRPVLRRGFDPSLKRLAPPGAHAEQALKRQIGELRKAKELPLPWHYEMVIPPVGTAWRCNVPGTALYLVYSATPETLILWVVRRIGE